MKKTNPVLYTQETINCIIDIGSVAQEMSDEMKRQVMDSLFKEAVDNKIVWKGKGKDQRWKFRDHAGKIVAKTTEEAIKKAYIEALAEKEKYGRADMTFGALFKLWLDYKHEGVGIGSGLLSPSMYKRYVNDHKKYIAGTDFDEMRLCDITPIDIENFFMGIAKDFNMGKQAFKNMRGYVKGAFSFAKKKRILTTDPFEDSDLSKCFAQCKKGSKPVCESVFPADGVRKLLALVYESEKKDELYMPNYAIELACFTAMRVGELAGLKWSAVRPNEIYIEASEHRYDFVDGPSVFLVGEPKNEKHRRFPMTKEMVDLFNRIHKVQKKHGIESEYVFEGINGRYTARKISQAMNRRCEKAGLLCKSLHGMRKTVSSHLRTMLPRATVAEMLGHLDEINDGFYNFDIMEMDYKKQKVSEFWNESFKPRETGHPAKV